MARARSTAGASKQAATDSETQYFLPESWRLFLQARAAEGLGTVLFIVAFLLALALISHGADDPSLNNAGTQSAKNILGFWGAALSDVLVQTLGLASIVLVLVPVGWGWRITSHQGLPYLWANAVAAPIALCLVALTLAASPLPDAWPYRAGLGGVLGDGLLDLAKAIPALVGITVPGFVVAIAAGFVGAFILLLSLGISRAEWMYLIRWFLFASRFVLYWVERGLTALLEMIAAFTANRREAKRQVGVDAVPLKRQAADEKPKAKKLKRKSEAAQEDAPATPALAPKAAATSKRVTRKPSPKKPSKRVEADRQPKLALDEGLGIDMPPLSILAAPPPNHNQNRLSDDALEQNARMLEGVLDDFGVKGEITEVRPGPVVTLYELTPAAGIKSSRVIGLADDIARSMSAISARVAVVPGKNAIGIELPNNDRETVYLRELLSSAEFDNKRSKITLAMGKDIGGAPVMADLGSMPHLLIAGTTGSGKSVSINTMILSVLYRMTPDQCRMIMIDPKMIELSVYDDIPHLLSPVVTDPKKAVVALKWAVREMEDRYRKMMKLGVRNITGYNQKIEDAEAKGEPITREVQTGYDEDGQPVVEQEALPLSALPYIVVVVDEMADLMMVAGKDVEASIQRLAQKARAAGIHLIMATQRPSVDVITGTIKANFPTRVSFQVTSKIDSRTILGEQGAEQLLGMGDMLYMAGGGRITRVHGPFVSDDEVEEVVNHLKAQGAPDYLDSVTDENEAELTNMIPGFGGGDGDGGGGSGDSLFDQAVAIVARDRKASTSYLQRKLQIGYNRAANLIEQMEEEGMISGPNHVGKREVLLPEHND